MKKLMTITVILVLGLLAGCNLHHLAKSKTQAYERWYHTRAEMLCAVASEHFKSGQLDKARIKTLEALTLNDQYTEGRLLLGKIYIEQGKYKRAIDELTVLVGAMPESHEVLYLLGVAQERSGLLEEALVSYRRSQALDGSDMSAVKAATEVLVAQGQLRQAQLYIESYISIAGDDQGVYEIAGRLAMMSGDYEKAVARYQYACDLDSENQGYLASLARAQFFARKYHEVVETLNELSESEEHSSTAWVFTMLGDSYMATGRLRNARNAYYRATELAPSDSGAWSNLAKSALAVRDLPRTIQAAKQAMELDSQSTDAALLLGFALLQTGHIPQSLSLLRRAIAMHPNSPELHCVLGRAHRAGGNQTEAMRCYAQALRIDPDNALAMELLNGGSMK